MRLKSVLLIGALSLLGLLLVVGVFLANEEKTYPEYWLQRRMDHFSAPRSQPAVVGDSLLRYKFYDDRGIDIAVELDNRNQLRLTKGIWFDDKKPQKSLSFRLPVATFHTLGKTFTQSWPSSHSHEVDDHFGGRYATLELQTGSGPQNAIMVAYYNATPDSTFTQFTKQLLGLAHQALKEEQK